MRYTTVEHRLAWLFGEVSCLRSRLIRTSCAKRKSPDFHIENEYEKLSFPSISKRTSLICEWGEDWPEF